MSEIRAAQHRPNAPKLTVEQAINRVRGIRKGYNVEVPKGSMTLGTAGLIDFISKSYHIVWVKGEPKKDKK